MSGDGQVIARELQDIVVAIDAVADEIRDKNLQVHVKLSDSPAPVVNVDPQVNVHVPQQAAPRIEVNVPAPVVSVEPQVQVDPVIHLPEVRPHAYRVRITSRDHMGHISEFRIEPLG